MKITVVGGGSWATALIKILSEKSVSIKWWLRDASSVEHIKTHRHNPEYLSSVTLDLKKVKPTTNLKQALKGTEWVIVAIPAAFLEDALGGLPKDVFRDKNIISGVKGMIPSQNILVTEWFESYFGVPSSRVGAIAGPCHAEEIALQKTSYLTIAANDAHLAKTFAEQLTCRYVRTTYIADLDGVEYAAVMKNIIALACGISHGLGSGDNFQAVMVSNAMLEIERLITAIAPLERQINASAYLGDLLVTSYSQFSRNRTFGKMIGKGYSVKTAQMELKMIAEGYYAAKCMHHINQKLQVKMPILDFVYNILYEKHNPKKAMEILKGELI
jgi:glycerol-3-phosphate dehydrogenase (NAD(P)+)